MTNEDLLADLKQFIGTAVSQAMSGVATKEDIARLDRRLDSMDRRFDDQDEKLDTILEALGEKLEAHDQQLTHHGARISKLEHKLA